MKAKLAGVLQSFQMLQHDIEADVEDLASRITDANARRQTLKTATTATMDAVHGGMKDIEDWLSAMEGSNGAPAGNSAGGSATSPPRSSDLTSK